MNTKVVGSQNVSLIPGMLFRHFEGKLYEIIGVCKDMNTKESMVTFMEVNVNAEPIMWILNSKEFLDILETSNGDRISRFSYDGIGYGFIS